MTHYREYFAVSYLGILILLMAVLQRRPASQSGLLTVSRLHLKGARRRQPGHVSFKAEGMHVWPPSLTLRCPYVDCA